MAHTTPILFAVLFFAFSISADAQNEKDLHWALPIGAEIVPIGKPSPQQMAYRQNGKTYLFSPGKAPISTPYDTLSYLYNDFWQSTKGGLKGIYHVKLGEVIPPVYEQIWPLSDWAFNVYKYAMEAVVNKQNRLVLPWRVNYSHDRMKCLGDTILEYWIHDAKYVSYNGFPVSNEAVELNRPPHFNRIASDRHVFNYRKDGVMQSDTFTGAEGFLDGIALARKDSLWGYLLGNGSWLIKPRFQAARPFEKSGFAVVKEHNLYGLIRKNGVYAVEPKFGFLKTSYKPIFEFKEADRIGLVDTLGRIVLPAGAYPYIFSGGRSTFNVKVGNFHQIYNNDGTRLPIDSVTMCFGDGFGEEVIVQKEVQGKNGYKPTLSGVVSGQGKILIPRTFLNSIISYRYFFVAEARMHSCCPIEGLSSDKNNPGKYLVFNRKGKLLLPYTVNIPQFAHELPFVVFTSNKKKGLVSKSGLVMEPEFDEIITSPNGWAYVRKGKEWGVLRWE